MPQASSTDHRFSRDLAKGVGLGLFIATGFTAWITILRLGGGTAPFDRLHTTYAATVALYYGGGLLGGILIGLLWPLHRWPLGAAVLGIVGVFPTYFGVALTRRSAMPLFTLSHLATSGAIALGVGGALGIWVWLDDNPTSTSWIQRLRVPTAATVARIWGAAGSLAAASYFGLARWTGAWPFGLVLGIAFATFVVPLAVAGLVTTAWLRAQSQDPRGSAT